MYPSLRSVTALSKFLQQAVITRLGGDDFDQTRVTDWMLGVSSRRQKALTFLTDKMALQRLKEAAEKAKKELSAATTTNINLAFHHCNSRRPKAF